MCFFGIDAAGDERRGDFADRARQFGGILPHRDGVQIDDAIDAVVAILQLDEALDGAEIVAEMQVAGRLHAGKHQFFEGHELSDMRPRGQGRARPERVGVQCHGGGLPRKGRPL